MIRIAICDDNAQTCALLHGYARRLAEEEGFPISIQTFTGGDELLRRYPERLDLLILDVQMPGINGIETARELRCFDREVTLVFMTNFAQYAIDGYSVQAYQYLLKPVAYSRFRKELAPILRQKIRQKGEGFCIKNDQGVFHVSVRQILYVETTVSKNVLVHLEGETITAYMSLRQAETELGSSGCFYRCHNSYLVNFNYVRSIQKDDVILSNGKRIPVSRQRRKEMVDRFMDYVGGLL